MKKRVFAASCLALVLALSLFMVACKKTDEFTVSVQCDDTQGSVTVSAGGGEPALSFKSGDSVLVTVKANDGYEVDSFTVNGENAELTDGAYTFYITSNTTVKVTFKKVSESLPAQEDLPAALESVKTTFKATGSYTYRVDGKDPEVNNVTTVFGDKAVSLFETDGDSGEIVYDDVYVDLDGKLAVPYHTLDNTIEYNYPANDELFEEYGNPFKLLTAADFGATDTNNVFELTASDKKDGAATAITGYNEKIVSFTVTVSDGKVTGVNIITDRIRRGNDDNAYYYTSEYSFTLSEWGKAAVDPEKISPYSTSAEHTALAQALEAARNAKNYTVNVYEVEPGYEDLQYNTYVTETAIYYACPDWENGYVQMGDGASKVVYPFDYDPDTTLVKLHDAVKGFPTVVSMRSSFNGFAPEIFECGEDGKYVLRADCNTTENIRDVLVNFADGLDVIRLYAGYAWSVSITLDEGVLHSVELLYVVGDAYVLRTMTYSDFDNTQMPISFDNCEKVSVLDDYVGTYTDGEVTVVIDKNGIVINDEVYEITDYDVQYDMFTGNWNGGEWYIAKQGGKQLILLNTDDDVTYVLTSTEIEPVAIPDAFGGVWSKNDKTVAIAYDKIEFDGTMLKVLSYDEEDGLYAVSGDSTYRFFAETAQDGTPVLLVIVYVDGLSTAYYDMTEVTDAVLLPEALIGTYEKFDSYYNKTYKAVIGLTAVALQLGEDSPAVTIVSATNADGYWELTLDVDGEEYFIAEGSYSADQVDLYSVASKFSVTLDRVSGGETPPPVADIPDTFYGTFSGEKDGVVYVVTISANGLSIKIGDDAAVDITEYEYDDGAIDFTVGDVQYGVFNYEYDTAIESLNIYSYDGLYATLTRGESGVEIPDDFVGTFEGEDSVNNITVKVIIAKDGVEVYINGEKKNATAEKVEEGYYGTELYILIDEVEYLFGPYGSSYTFSSFADNGAALYATLTKTEGENPPVGGCAWVKLFGTFSGEKDGTAYSVTIDDDGVSLTVGGVAKEVTVVSYDDYEGFTVTFDGEEYYISQGYDNEVTGIMLVSSDYSLRVTLTKE